MKAEDEEVKKKLQETLGQCVGVVRDMFSDDGITVLVIRQQQDDDANMTVSWAGMVSTLVSPDVLHQSLALTTRGVAERIGLMMIDSVYSGGADDAD